MKQVQKLNIDASCITRWWQTGSERKGGNMGIINQAYMAYKS